MVKIPLRIILTLVMVKIPAKKNQYIFLFLILILVNKLLKYIFSKTCKISISMLSILFIYLFILFFRAGLTNTRALMHACCYTVQVN